MNSPMDLRLLLPEKMKTENQLSKIKPADRLASVSEYYFSKKLKDVYVGGMPQFAGTFGVRYFVNYWFLGQR